MLFDFPLSSQATLSPHFLQMPSKTFNVRIKGINGVTMRIFHCDLIFIKKKVMIWSQWEKFVFVSGLVIYDALRSESIRRDRHRFRGDRARSDVRGYSRGQARAAKCAEGSSKLYWWALLMWSQSWGVYVCVSRGSVISVAQWIVAWQGWDLSDPEGLQDGGGEDTHIDSVPPHRTHTHTHTHTIDR